MPACHAGDRRFESGRVRQSPFQPAPGPSRSGLDPGEVKSSHGGLVERVVEARPDGVSPAGTAAGRPLPAGCCRLRRVRHHRRRAEGGARVAEAHPAHCARARRPRAHRFAHACGVVQRAAHHRGGTGRAAGHGGGPGRATGSRRLHRPSDARRPGGRLLGDDRRHHAEPGRRGPRSRRACRVQEGRGGRRRPGGPGGVARRPYPRARGRRRRGGRRESRRTRRPGLPGRDRRDTASPGTRRRRPIALRQRACRERHGVAPAGEPDGRRPG